MSAIYAHIHTLTYINKHKYTYTYSYSYIHSYSYSYIHLLLYTYTLVGLSAIYAAVVESRRIFRMLKSYTTYRFAATIHIVLVLTLLIYISNCSINSFYIVLLALFNDVTMLPIAYDIQSASKLPEKPEVRKLLIIASFLGM